MRPYAKHKDTAALVSKRPCQYRLWDKTEQALNPCGQPAHFGVTLNPETDDQGEVTATYPKPVFLCEEHRPFVDGITLTIPEVRTYVTSNTYEEEV